MKTINKSVLIVGASSGIGSALAEVFASHGWSLTIAARREAALDSLAVKLKTQYGSSVTCVNCDITAKDAASKLHLALKELPTVMVCTAGFLGDPAKADSEPHESETVMMTNFTATVRLFQYFAPLFKLRGDGTLIGISSVAGERGKSKNMIYSASKAGLTSYLSGLRNSLYHAGVHVITVIPGYVRTPMVAHLNLAASLTSEPEAVALRIYKALDKKQNVVYSTCRWRLMMLLMHHIPEGWYKKKKWDQR